MNFDFRASHQATPIRRVTLGGWAYPLDTSQDVVKIQMPCFLLSYEKDSLGGFWAFLRHENQRTMESGVCCLKDIEEVTSESGRSVQIER